MQSRPFGLSLIAVLAGILGAVALVAALAWWGSAEYISFLPRLHSLHRFIALVLAAVAALEFVLAWGLWTLRPWAWALGVILEIAAIVAAVGQLGHGFPGIHVVSVALAAVALWYLFRPEVRLALKV
jgi:hypothetical protein